MKPQKTMFHKRQEYYQVLGEFLKKFSEMETSLIAFCSIIKYLSYCQEGFDKYSPLTISQRTEFISEFINENLPDIKNDWIQIKQKIGMINEDRRYLIHGIGRSGLSQDTITTHAPKKGQTVKKEYSIEDIKKIIYSIEDVCNGDNGLQGEFLNKFTTFRYDLYNDQIDNNRKICYRISGEIVTMYKGG